VLLDKSHHIKLGDFGLALVKQESASSITQQSVGTTAWMAPELFKRRAEYSKATDIYSLGILFWELASRAIPFSDAENVGIIVGWIMQGEREEIPEGTPQWLADLIEACWHADPSKRPDILKVVEWLESGVAEEKVKDSGLAVNPQVAPIQAAAPSATQSNLFDSQAGSPGYLSGLHGAHASVLGNYHSGIPLPTSEVSQPAASQLSNLNLFGAYVSQAENVPQTNESKNNDYSNPSFS